MEENNDIMKSMSASEKVSWLAALGWPEGDIAQSLGLSYSDFMNRVADPADELFDSVNRGRLQKRAEVEIKIARGAAAGDTDSIKQFSEIVRDRSFSISKLDLFGGAEKEGSFQRIQDYIASGSKGSLSEKEQVYVDILTLIYSLDGQYGKRRTIKFLTSAPFNFSYDHASDMYSEATEMFYCNRKISKEALRNKIADQFDALYIAARDAAQTSKDYEVAANILANKARALQLDKEDPAKLPAEMYVKPFRVLSLTPEAIGLPTVNRQELGRQIEGLVAPEMVKKRLKMEAGVTDMNVEEMLSNGVQEES
ncbi:MAG: hypothetical protein PUB47_01605 [Bacteroides sp.]|nr:hypothetical protein [Bacteroides sp.]